MFKLTSPFNLIKNAANAKSPILRSLVHTPVGKRMFSNTPLNTARRFNQSTRNKSNMSLTFLGVLGVSSLYLAAHKPILNDAAYANPPVSVTTPGSTNIYYDKNKPLLDGAFGGKLNYHQVAIGSITGLILGYTISKLSTVVFVASLMMYMLTIYLRKQGIIVVNTKGVIKGAVNSISWDELVFDQPSFSGSFITSFCIAATL